jgi:hypothetical protein
LRCSGLNRRAIDSFRCSLMDLFATLPFRVL